MVTWDNVHRELDEWAASGRVATLWWRDDDAVSVTPALERGLVLSAGTGTAVGLAVIPRDARPELAEHLLSVPTAFVLLHGFGHVNHAPPGAEQDEYGPHRPLDTRLAELAEGRNRLTGFPR
ncbi:MAG: hypothetical protein HQL37_16110, partial [Alphaproteobacteria bacterium]|nr:hypothetical protein [Alphaproteobacteria bacterium]